MNTFTLRDLSFSYREHPVLQELSMEVKPGRLHALVGANGAGKSTLIKILAGLMEANAGEIYLGGEPIGDLSDRERAKKIAYMAQEVQVPGAFMAGEIVSMARFAFRKETDAETDEKHIIGAMQRTGTLPFYRKRIGEISGGEKQRVLLAKALAQGTDILLLDEVTSALDINHQLAVMEDLREWLNEDRTILMVLHDINLAARYADEIWLLADGKIIAHGPPETLINQKNIQTVYEVDSFIDRNPVTDTPVVIPVERRKQTLTDLPVHVVSGGGTGSQVLSALYGWGVHLSAGILNIGDSDQVTAQRIGAELFTIQAFSEVQSDDTARIIEKMDRIKAVVLTNLPIGAGNVQNLELIRFAKEKEIPVLYCPWQVGVQYIHKSFEKEWEEALEGTVLCSSPESLRIELEKRIVRS